MTTILPIPRFGAKSDAPSFGIAYASEEAGASSSEEPLQSMQIERMPDATRESLSVAAAHLRAGELVALPTETVYGLGASALDAQAAAKIYKAKNRPADNPLIVHVSDCAMIRQLVPDGYEVNDVSRALMNAFWPGPLTLLLPARPPTQQGGGVPSIVTCGQPTVGVRMPSHPLARALIHLAGVPIAAPSANASGRPSPTSAEHVRADLGYGGMLRYIVDGGVCEVGVESTVVDAVSTAGEVRVLRPGGVTVEAIAQVLTAHGLLEGQGARPGAVRLRVCGKDLALDKREELAPTTPGMKYRHYSPEARVILVRFDPNASGSLSTLIGKQLRAITAVRESVNADGGAVLSPGDSPGECLRVGFMVARDSPLLGLATLQLDTEDAERVRRWQDHEDAGTSTALSPAFDGNSDGAAYRACIYSLGPLNAPDVTAQRLFDGLRTLDSSVQWSAAAAAQDTCDLIFVEAVGEEGMGLAVMNRLQKAASETHAVRYA